MKKGKIPALRAAVILATLALLSLACTIGGLTLNRQAASLNITLTQDQVNTIFKNIDLTNVTGSDRLIKEIKGVELHEGVIRVDVIAQAPDGSEYPGSVDLGLTTENDLLKVQITAVSVPGVDLNDPRIVKANQELTQALTESIQKTNGNVRFKTAQVKEGELNLTVEVALQ